MPGKNGKGKPQPPAVSVRPTGPVADGQPLASPRDPTRELRTVEFEEPVGYKGRRRRFRLFTRNGGVVLPAILVGLSVVTVAAVLVVSQMLPQAEGARIPMAADSGSPTTDHILDSPVATPSDLSSVSPSASASASGSAKPSASPSRSATKSPAPSPTPPVATGVSYEAESTGNTFAGSAKAAACGACSGGGRVQGIGGSSANYVTINKVTVSNGGTYHLIITYESTAALSFSVSANGATAVTVSCPAGTSLTTPKTISTTIVLNGGANTLKFANSGAAAPDLDKITISP
jgi:hypothetical protein